MSVTRRLVLVTRATDYERLLARHATVGQAAFYLRQRDQEIAPLRIAHEKQRSAVTLVTTQVPNDWRFIHISREDLAQFVFEPNDVVTALGQDGLVANSARYLNGQVVIGINPNHTEHPGLLAKYEPAALGDLLITVQSQSLKIQERTMVSATLDDGESITCLNEVFVGHRTHQSARYTLFDGARREHQSSSGLIVATGSGASGWAKSIHRASHSKLTLPKPNERYLTYFVREAWPSPTTGTDLTDGIVDAEHRLRLISRMDHNGVVFGDGIESDYLTFGYGQQLTIEPAAQTLRLLAC